MRWLCLWLFSWNSLGASSHGPAPSVLASHSRERKRDFGVLYMKRLRQRAVTIIRIQREREREREETPTPHSFIQQILLDTSLFFSLLEYCLLFFFFFFLLSSFLSLHHLSKTHILSLSLSPLRKVKNEMTCWLLEIERIRKASVCVCGEIETHILCAQVFQALKIHMPNYSFLFFFF